MKTQTHRVQTRYARRHAARAIAERCGSAVGCILDARRDPTDHHAVILHVNSGGNAIAAETALREAGYAVEHTDYDPFAPGHYGVKIRVRPSGVPA